RGLVRLRSRAPAPPPLPRRLGQGEPSPRVALGEPSDPPRSWRPLHRKGVACEPGGISFALDGPHPHRLGARLPEAAEPQEFPLRCYPRLLGDLSACLPQWIPAPRGRHLVLRPR